MIVHNCLQCHEQIRAPKEHICGRTPYGTLPANQPHKQFDPHLCQAHADVHTLYAYAHNQTRSDC